MMQSSWSRSGKVIGAKARESPTMRAPGTKLMRVAPTHHPSFPTESFTLPLHTTFDNPVKPSDRPQPCRGDTIQGSVPRHSLRWYHS